MDTQCTFPSLKIQVSPTHFHPCYAPSVRSICSHTLPSIETRSETTTGHCLHSITTKIFFCSINLLCVTSWANAQNFLVTNFHAYFGLFVTHIESTCPEPVRNILKVLSYQIFKLTSVSCRALFHALLQASNCYRSTTIHQLTVTLLRLV